MQATDIKQDKLTNSLSADGWRADLGQLATLAGPIVLSTAAETMLSFTDFAIVSQLGSAAQAAVQTGTMVFMSIYAPLLGIMLCVTTVVSQSFGAKRLADCSAYAWQGIWLSLLIGGLAILLLPLLPPFFALFGHAQDVFEMEVTYTRLRIWSLGAAGACLALGNFFNGIHQPVQNTISVLVTIVLNALLSYGLVFGRWGLPEMGIAGAAWGTIISTIFRVGWLLVAMCSSRQTTQFQPLQTIRWNTDKVVRLVRVGFPSGVGLMLDISAWALFMTWIIGQFGTAHMAATATAWRYTELSFMPGIGIGFAVSTLVGKSIGEGRFDLAYRRTRLGVIVTTLYMGSLGVVFLLFGRELMDLFSDDPEVIAIGAQLLIFAAVFQLSDAACVTYSNALRGAGDTRYLMFVGTTLIWSITVGGSLLTIRLWPQLGSAGPWACATLFVIVLGFALWRRWRSGAWEKIDVIGREPAPVEENPPAIAAQVAMMDPVVGEDPAEAPQQVA
jgi:MATE family multidrug resistance protein